MSEGFFGPLQVLRERPIPDLTEDRRRRAGYRTHAIMASELFDEPLVDIGSLGIDGWSQFSRNDNPPYYQEFPGALSTLLLRRSVAGRLAGVDASLRARGIKLLVQDAYRPTEVQAFAHDVWMPARLRRHDPSLDGAALTEAVEAYWARPTSDGASPAPHKTGAAVDLTLAFVASGQALFMGTILDDVTELAHTESFEARRHSASYSDQEAVANRRLLYWAMLDAGFSNAPNEWWHYSWGDQMWARLTGAAAALYGPAEPALL